MDNQKQAAQQESVSANEELLARVGQLTRTLHDSLRALGLDKVIQDAARDIPDVQDRLKYVVSMTEQAAERVLNATDAAIPLQEAISRDCLRLAGALRDGGEPEAIAGEMAGLAGKADMTKQQLLDIMMAQDFQDLTGQVIRRIIELAQTLESQLVQMLVDYSPAEVRKEVSNSLLNGPQINKEAEDVVADQGQIDDLLSSLGF